MITLRIIFYGLMAFVPSNNGEGMLVLFADPNRVESARPHTDEDSHLALAFVVEEVETYEDGKTGLKLTALPYWDPEHPPRAYVEAYPFFAEPIEIAQDLQPSDADPLQPLPVTASQTRDFAWSPSITGIAPESAGIRAECLVNPRECPISAVFRLWQSEVRACHLAHIPREEMQYAEAPLRSYAAPLARNDASALSNAIAYSFRSEGARPRLEDPLQAVADAVVVDIMVPGDDPVLHVSYLEEEKYIDIPLGPPNLRGVITLLFANVAVVPEDRRPRRHRRHLPLASQHYRAFYHLAHTEPDSIYQVIPHATQYEAPLPFPMDCEAEIVVLEEHLKARNVARFAKKERPYYVPHSIEVCGTTKFPTTLLPSWRSEIPIGDPATDGSPTATRTPPPPPRRVRGADGVVRPVQSDRP